MSLGQHVEAANGGDRCGDRREDVQDLRDSVIPRYLCEELPVNYPKGFQVLALSQEAGVGLRPVERDLVNRELAIDVRSQRGVIDRAAQRDLQRHLIRG